MPITEKNLAVLYHNQMNHFDDLRSRGIDPGIPDNKIYDLIRFTFTNSIVSDAFTLHVMSKPDQPLKHIHAIKSSQGASRAEEIELAMELYKPVLRNIPMLSADVLMQAAAVLSAEKTDEALFEVFAQEYKKALDYEVIRMARAASEMADNESVFFDAQKIKELPNIRALLPDLSDEIIMQINAMLPQDSYLHRAQTISEGIEKAGDLMYNDIMRGGVSRLINGSAAAAYLRLNAQFTSKCAQHRIAAYQIGEIHGIPVYKVSRESLLLENECLCVWKNESNECDVAIAACVYIPFFYDQETKQYSIKGDFVTLEPRYIKKLSIINIRDF